MRRIRVLSIAIFLIAVAVCGIYNISHIRNQDLLGPKITMAEKSITVSTEATDEELLAGITAEDKKDGDVTDSLIIESKSNFIEEGRRMITVAAFDSDNHVTKASREVIYNDYDSPRFSLAEPLKFPLNVDNILEGVSVTDVLDGDLTANIKISGDSFVQVDQEGDYPMVFSVSNSAGDVEELPVTVQICQPGKGPEILLSQYLIYTGVGAAVNPWDYVEQISMSGKTYVRGGDGILHAGGSGNNQAGSAISESGVRITNNVNYDVPGTYEITYQITEGNGYTGTVRLIVVVRE